MEKNKMNMKSQCYQMQKLQQSECINDQQMSHKVTELPTGIQSGAETGAGEGNLEFKRFWKDEGRGFDFAKATVETSCVLKASFRAFKWFKLPCK